MDNLTTSQEIHILADFARDNTLFDELSPRLIPEYFENAHYRALFAEMVKHGTSTGLYAFPLSESAQKALQMLGSYPPSGQTAAIVSKFIDNAKTVQLKKVMSDVSLMSHGMTYQEIISMIEQGVEAVEKNCGSDLGTVELSDYADLAYEFLTMTREQRQENGMSFPWEGLNDCMYLRKSSLNLICAGTSKGKSVVVNNLMRHTSKLGAKGLFFSFEMDATEVAARAVSGISKTNTRGIYESKSLDMEGELMRMKMARDEIKEYSVRVFDDRLIGVKEICSIARNHHRKGLCDILYVDYIGLIELEGKSFDNKSSAVGDISKRLKALSKSLQIPVVALAQLNRKADEVDGAPQLNHIADSIDLARDSNVVIMIDYDEKNAKKYMDEYNAGLSPKGFPAYFHVRKNRYGEKGDVQMAYEIESGNFYDWDWSRDFKMYGEEVGQASARRGFK